MRGYGASERIFLDDALGEFCSNGEDEISLLHARVLWTEHVYVIGYYKIPCATWPGNSVGSRVRQASGARKEAFPEWLLGFGLFTCLFRHA